MVIGPSRSRRLRRGAFPRQKARPWAGPEWAGAVRREYREDRVELVLEARRKVGVEVAEGDPAVGDVLDRQAPDRLPVAIATMAAVTATS